MAQSHALSGVLFIRENPCDSRQKNALVFLRQAFVLVVTCLGFFRVQELATNLFPVVKVRHALGIQ